MRNRAIAALVALLACSVMLSRAQEKQAGPVFDLTPPPPLTPEQALAAFKIEDGFRIELVASEPMIQAPVAISFDDQGRLYVVEMRGYMNDVAGAGEKEPTGRVTLLTDTDGDGRMDKATSFRDGLVLPRAVMAVNGGVLLGVPPQLLFCKDTDGDGRADVMEVVGKDFGSTGNPEHSPNAPTWMMDNWVWLAESNARYRWHGGAWIRDAGLGRGQWGLTQDDSGRIFYNYNQDILRCDLLPAAPFAAHPPLAQAATSLNYKVIQSRTLWPGHPTRSVTGLRNPLVAFRPDGSIKAADSTCGPLIYRGDAMPAARGNAFVCEPVGNLVKRLTLRESDGVITADHATEGREFLISTDERFRPVLCANGPDGALYIVDMYRGVMEHRTYMNDVLAADAKSRGLEQPLDRGRIWRVVSASGARPKVVKLPAATAGRVAALAHANGWVRDTAQRLLVESSAKDAEPLLVEMLRGNGTPVARLHALWTLEGLDAITPEIVRAALRDADAQVRAAAARVAPREIASELMALVSDPDVLVRANVASRLASLPEAEAALLKLLTSDGKNALIREAALTGVRGRERAFAASLAKQTGHEANTQPVIELLQRLAAKAKPANPRTQEPLTPAQNALFEKGRTLYAALCAACHQPHGFGLDGLAPPLVDSEWVLGRPDIAARIILHGVAGPLRVGQRTWTLAMPPLPQLADDDIAAVLTYIRREWDHAASPVEPKFITELRGKHKDRQLPWSETELKR